VPLVTGCRSNWDTAGFSVGDANQVHGLSFLSTEIRLGPKSTKSRNGSGVPLVAHSGRSAPISLTGRKSKIPVSQEPLLLMEYSSELQGVRG
jgi:hypothetical protein